MNKKVSMLLCTFGIATVALMGAGCSVGITIKQTFCKHDYGVTATKVVEESTCYKKGKELWTCNICGKEKTVAIEKPEHAYDEGTVIKEATCVDEGKIKYVCQTKDCGEEKTEVIQKKEHKVVMVASVVPTCTTGGHTAYTYCSDCNTYILAKQELPALGHSPTLVRGHDATCTESGLTDGILCVTCDEFLEEQEVIPAHGHTIVTIPAVEPTCTDKGLTAGSMCGTCDTVFVAQEEIPSLGGHVEDETTGTCKWCDFEFKHTLENGYVLEYAEEYSGTVYRDNNSNPTIKTVKDCYILTNPNKVTVERLIVPAMYAGKQVHVGKNLFKDMYQNQAESLLEVRFNGACVIFDRAFENCGNLQTVSFPEYQCVTLCEGAFSGCGSLKSVEVLTDNIGSATFANCNGLETFTVIGSQTVTIGDGAFSACKKLTSFEVENVRFIGGCALYFYNGENSLTTLSFNEAYLDNCTFMNFTDTTSISIKKCSYLGIGVFNKCSANIYIEDITSDFTAYGSAESVFGDFSGKIVVGSGVKAMIQAKTGWTNEVMKQYFIDEWTNNY